MWIRLFFYLSSPPPPLLLRRHGTVSHDSQADIALSRGPLFVFAKKIHFIHLFAIHSYDDHVCFFLTLLFIAFSLPLCMALPREVQVFLGRLANSQGSPWAVFDSYTDSDFSDVVLLYTAESSICIQNMTKSVIHIQKFTKLAIHIHTLICT